MFYYCVSQRACQLLLCFLACFLNLQVLSILASFTPKARYAHTSVLINDKLYFLGGNVEGIPSNELFYLDLSSSFKITNPTWVDLTSTQSIPVKSSWAAASNDSVLIYLIGGAMLNKDQVSLSNKYIVFVYDTTARSWKNPEISGSTDSTPTRRRLAQVVMDNSKIYYFGGRSDNYTGDPLNNTDSNSLDILDTITWKWTLGTTISAPSARDGYTATLLDGIIWFIGGREFNSQNGSFNVVNINEFHMYSTKTSEWLQFTMEGAAIDNRFSHSAVATGNLIIIYGGINDANQISSPQLAVLNLTVDNFHWQNYTEKTELTPPPLSSHSATKIGKYMLVAFGVVTNDKPSVNSEIYFLDTSTWTWVQSFDKISGPKPSTPINFGIVIGMTIAGIVVLICGMIAGALYIRRVRGESASLPTPGSSTPSPNSMLKIESKEDIDTISYTRSVPPPYSSGSSSVEGSIGKTDLRYSVNSSVVGSASCASDETSYTRSIASSHPLFTSYSSLKGEAGQ